MKTTVKAWWAFSRPHTIIGSFFSITALYVISCAIIAGTAANALLLMQQYAIGYLVTLLSALACNVFIVGLNQWQDIEVDRINKPWLPLAAGTISLPQAKGAVWISLLISLGTAAWLGWSFLLLIVFINIIGAAYSLPPLKLKRHHLPAAMAIVTVRGLLVNLGMAAHFAQLITGNWFIPLAIWPLALFVVGFSFGIAWFKDIPDTAGDAQFAFKTLAVSMSRNTALWLGVAVVSIAYILVAVSPLVFYMPVHIIFFSLSHVVLCIVFIVKAFKLSLNNETAIKSFYMFFWLLFFLEYIIYPVAFLL
jgi:homogentisate phytyltransferase / homogentisate geranylgeranyltransferase